jgi:biotin transport system substrate-specific component
MFDTRDIVRISLFAALIAAMGLFPRLDIPLAGGVPITLQTLGVMLAGALLGPWRGAVSVLLFLLLVAVGAPLLAGGRGGLGVFFGPTAGYLIGWVPGAYVTGWLMQKPWPGNLFLRVYVAAVVGGVLVIHAFGLFCLAWKVGMSLRQAVVADFIFVPGDILKALACAYVASIGNFRRFNSPKPS